MGVVRGSSPRESIFFSLHFYFISFFFFALHDEDKSWLACRRDFRTGRVMHIDRPGLIPSMKDSIVLSYSYYHTTQLLFLYLFSRVTSVITTTNLTWRTGLEYNLFRHLPPNATATLERCSHSNADLGEWLVYRTPSIPANDASDLCYLDLKESSSKAS